MSLECTTCNIKYSSDPGVCGRCANSTFRPIGSAIPSPIQVDPPPPSANAPKNRICRANGCGQMVPEGNAECLYCGEAFAPQCDPPFLLLPNGNRIPLVVGETVVIGRDPDQSPWAHSVEDYPKVSRRHVSIQSRDGLLRIDDLGSSNGTWVNGIKVDSTVDVELAEGVSIRMGRDVVMVVGIDG